MEVKSLPTASSKNKGSQLEHSVNGHDQNLEKFVTLFLQPLLKCLWLVGFPVPSLCTHRTSLHQSSTFCCFFRRVKPDSKKESIETGKETSLNSANQTSSSDVKSDEDTGHYVTWTEDRLTHLRKGWKSNTHYKEGEIIDINTRNFKTPLPHEADKNSAEEEFSRVQVAEAETDPSSSSQPSLRIQGRNAGARKKMRDVQKQTCGKCQTKRVLGRLLFGFNVTLQAVNIARYLSIFSFVKVMDGGVVACIVFMIFFLAAFYVYVASFFSLCKHMDPLIRLQQAYVQQYSSSINYKSFNRRLKFAVRMFLVVEVAVSIVMVSGFHSFFPTFKKHLAPFSQATGVSLYIVSVAFGLVICLIITTFCCLFFFLHEQSFFLKREFGVVSQQFKAVIGSHEDFILSISNQTTSDVDETFEPNTQRTNNSSHVSQNGTKSHCFKNPARMDPSHSRVENPEPSSLTHKESSQVSRINKEAVDQNTPILSQNASSLLPQRRHESGSESHQNADTKHDTGEAVAPDSGSGCVPTESHVRLGGGASVDFLLAGGVGDCEDQTQVTTSDWHEKHVNDAFDYLRMQHQTLCAITQRLHGCLVHLMSTAFISGIPQFCLVIYGLGSSSLGQDEALFMTFIITQVLLAMVTCILKGIIVRDSAHAPQAVIYGADWSKLSPMLLPKMQLLAAQLGHTQIGYDVYGLFAIDRSAVLMVIGTLMTYTVVVIQFQLSETTPTCVMSNSTTVTA